MYEHSAITDQGKALLAACIAAGHAIEFTSYVLGAGTYTDAEKTVASLKQRTALKVQKQTFSFTSATASDAEAILRVQVDNDNLAEGYYMTEAGIYAKDETDNDTPPILYQIGVDDTPSYMPDEDTPLAIDTECHTIIDNVANVTFTFTHGAYAWADDLGDINQLTTTNKDNAVEAINEVKDEVRPVSKGGTGSNGSFEALQNLGGVQLGATSSKNTDSLVATSDWRGGKIFNKDGYFYKATKNITNGDTLYLTGPNKNIALVTLADDVSDSVKKEALADYAENDFYASRYYTTVGVYIYIRAAGELYKTTASIDYGEALIDGTNVEQVTVGGELSALSSDLASKANCIKIDSAVTSPYFFYSVDGATALFGAIPSLYMGLCYASFKNSINTICLVNKANGAYGTIILMNDIGSAPLLISVSGGTLTVKDFTVS